MTSRKVNSNSVVTYYLLAVTFRIMAHLVHFWTRMVVVYRLSRDVVLFQREQDKSIENIVAVFSLFLKS